MTRRYHETDARESDKVMWQMLWGSILLMGGVLTVAVLLITQANLSAESIYNVLIPGCFIGMDLMLVGGVGVSRVEKSDN